MAGREEGAAGVLLGGSGREGGARRPLGLARAQGSKPALAQGQYAPRVQAVQLHLVRGYTRHAQVARIQVHAGERVMSGTSQHRESAEEERGEEQRGNEE